MALAADSLRSLLKANLHNDTTFTDPGDLNTFLTLGQRRIVRDSPSTLGAKLGTISTTSSQQEDDLASDFYMMRGIWHQTNGVDLIYYPQDAFIEEVERLSTIPSGAPTGYTILGYAASDAWKIRWDHTPDAVYTIKYWYYWMPADVSGTTTPPVSAVGFDDLLLASATIIALERNDPDGAAQWMQKHYLPLLADYRAYRAHRGDATNRQQSRAFLRTGSTVRLDPTFFPGQ